MIKSRTRKAGALAIGLTCVLAGWALAQQQDPVRQPGQPGVAAQPQVGDRAATGTATPDINRYFANCWAAKNKAEIELSQIAEQRASNPQVKQFAQEMVQQHSDLSRKLQPLAQEQAAGAGSQVINQLIAIDRQIGDRITESFKQKLEEKAGAEFDQCYIGGQVACHMEASAALAVLSQQTSGQLQQLASQTKQTVDQHLKQAEKLAQQLMQSQTGRQPATTGTGTFRDRNLQRTSAEQ